MSIILATACVVCLLRNDATPGPMTLLRNVKYAFGCFEGLDLRWGGVVPSLPARCCATEMQIIKTFLICLHVFAKVGARIRGNREGLGV